jgi:hypothetical protein
MTKLSKLTHFFAAAVAAAATFFATPAGLALLHQYPHLIPIVGGLAAIGLTYRNPTAPVQ